MATEIDPRLTPQTNADNEQSGTAAMHTLMKEALAAQAKHQYSLIPEASEEAELRRNQRKKYTCIQLVAPYEGRRMPAQADFQPQLCHDLSPTGFSFWQEKPLAVSHLIVALGEVPFLFFVAEIVHQDYEPHGEPGGWRIGCRFIRRVER